MMSGVAGSGPGHQPNGENGKYRRWEGLDEHGDSQLTSHMHAHAQHVCSANKICLGKGLAVVGMARLQQNILAHSARTGLGREVSAR